MQVVTTVGLDIAKSVFQVHGVDAAGQVVIRRQLKRRYVLAFFQKLPACLVGIEACASSHHWSRELKALGHTVRLRQYQQTRRPLSAQPVHGWRAHRHSLCEDPRHQASALAHGVIGAAAHQGRRHCACQQTRADGLGHDEQGRTLQRTRRAGGVNEIAPATRRDAKVGKGKQHVMQNRSIW